MQSNHTTESGSYQVNTLINNSDVIMAREWLQAVGRAKAIFVVVVIKDVLVRFSLSRGHPHDVRTLLMKSPKTKFGFDTAQAYTLMCKKVFTSAGKRLHTQSLTHYWLKLRIFDEKVGRGGGGGRGKGCIKWEKAEERIKKVRMTFSLFVLATNRAQTTNSLHASHSALNLSFRFALGRALFGSRRGGNQIGRN